MRKTLVLSLLILSLGLNGGAAAQDQKSKQQKAKRLESVVYVCNSSSAYAYHSDRNCKGLSRCNHGVLKMSKSEAVNSYRRKACKICY